MRRHNQSDRILLDAQFNALKDHAVICKSLKILKIFARKSYSQRCRKKSCCSGHLCLQDLILETSVSLNLVLRTVNHISSITYGIYTGTKLCLGIDLVT